MTTFHVLAAAGDFADELRSLGLHEAPSAHAALERCLAELDQDPLADQDAVRDAELAELLRRDQQQLRDALPEPDVSFIVTPDAAEAHFARDHDRAVRPADEVERRRARTRREFGVDVVTRQRQPGGALPAVQKCPARDEVAHGADTHEWPS